MIWFFSTFYWKKLEQFSIENFETSLSTTEFNSQLTVCGMYSFPIKVYAIVRRKKNFFSLYLFQCHTKMTDVSSAYYMIFKRFSWKITWIFMKNNYNKHLYALNGFYSMYFVFKNWLFPSNIKTGAIFLYF